MTLIDEMTAAAGHLRSAARMAVDWRVREAVAGAGTAVECALFIQRKIAAGELTVEKEAPSTNSCARETRSVEGNPPSSDYGAART
jgi:hypothetical protein